MSKGERSEDSFGVGSGWTNWDSNSEYNYSLGTCLTKQGIIVLYWQDDYARARIIHRGRCYALKIDGSITKLGLVRIAKKWAREKGGD